MGDLTRENLGFLLAKASQRWNELLRERFAAARFPEVRPAFGSVLVPLFEEDGLRMGDLARRSRLAKQTMTTLVRMTERAGLVRREADPQDGRAARVFLTPRAQAFRPVAEQVVSDLEELASNRLSPARQETVRTALKILSDL